MGTKLIKNVDDEVWRRFTGQCKVDNELVGKRISRVLDSYLKGDKR